MNDEERDAILLEIQIKIAKIQTDIVWFKRVGSAAIIITSVCLSAILNAIFIH